MHGLQVGADGLAWAVVLSHPATALGPHARSAAAWPAVTAGTVSVVCDRVAGTLSVGVNGSPPEPVLSGLPSEGELFPIAGNGGGTHAQPGFVRVYGPS